MIIELLTRKWESNRGYSATLSGTTVNFICHVSVKKTTENYHLGNPVSNKEKYKFAIKNRNASCRK